MPHPTAVNSVPESLSYSRSDWQAGYQSLKEEYDYWIDDVEGCIPPELSGTLFRNGPGMLDINGTPIHHPFDGDGMVCAIAFDQGRAHFRNRHVKTEGFIREQKAGKVLYRGVFGTQREGGWLANIFDLKFKNIANTNIIYWGDKLLALWEAAEPHRLDPATLETLGLDDVDGAVPSGGAFAAHPWVDPACVWDGGKPHLVNFSITPGLSTTITVYELDTEGSIVSKHAHSVPGFAFMHDFAITPNYCIFFQASIRFNPIPALLGFKTPGQCLDLKAEEDTHIIVIPRHGSAPVKTIPATVGFVFHHANAWEREDGELEICSICYDDFPKIEPDDNYLDVDFDAYPPGQLWRFRVNLETSTVQSEKLDNRSCEFPTVHPNRVGRPSRFLFMGATHNPIGNAPLQAIWKIDLKTGDRQLWSAAPRGFVSEPVFVPRQHADLASDGAEDDGWLMVMVYNAEGDRSELVILDAQDLRKGAIARLRLKHHIPYGLHGSFTSEVFV
ncbi:MAG: carotenoid oxygenase family protein [Cyanobacteria bacterium J06626_14]